MVNKIIKCPMCGKILDKGNCIVRNGKCCYHCDKCHCEQQMANIIEIKRQEGELNE